MVVECFPFYERHSTMQSGMDEADLFLPEERTVAISDAESVRLLPARWAVAVLAGEDGRAVQVVCWKNLRQTLSARLAEQPAEPSRRVDWRQVVRQVRWRAVDSRFEADWIYLETVRRVFPETWRELVPWAQTYFLHIDPDEAFPKYARTSCLPENGLTVGPLPDAKSAARLIELLEDAFDLCRYHSILLQSPNGKACAYKDMGKCPAPCDGSISMAQYHRLIDRSLAALADPAALIAEQKMRMEQAAGELRFETAAKIKAYVSQLELLGKGAFKCAMPLGRFAFVTLQQGRREGQVKILLALPDRIEPVACLFGPEADLAEIDKAIHHRAAVSVAPDSAQAERIGLVARHLFDRKPTGAWIGLCDVNPASLRAAYRAVSRNAAAEVDNRDNG
jgi:hypothetical protein